jgi:hypothetical protein
MIFVATKNGWKKNCLSSALLVLLLDPGWIIYNFMIFVATKIVGQKVCFSPSSFGAVVGSGVDKNQDPG